jgi:hypothetical protein
MMGNYHSDDSSGKHRWDCAVQAQLDNLKLWLELQFTALNRKIDAIVEKQRYHRKVCHVNWRGVVNILGAWLKIL